jgi:hypothetical protein
MFSNGGGLGAFASDVSAGLTWLQCRPMEIVGRKQGRSVSLARRAESPKRYDACACPSIESGPMAGVARRVRIQLDASDEGR